MKYELIQLHIYETRTRQNLTKGGREGSGDKGGRTTRSGRCSFSLPWPEGKWRHTSFSRNSWRLLFSFISTRCVIVQQQGEHVVGCSAIIILFSTRSPLKNFSCSVLPWMSVNGQQDGAWPCNLQGCLWWTNSGRPRPDQFSLLNHQY